MKDRHVVQIEREWEERGEEFSYWECSCGRSGTAKSYRVDIASDKHIPADAQRIDRHSGR